MSISMIIIWVAVQHVQPDILSHGLATKLQLQVWDLVTRWSHENGTGMGWIGLGVVSQIPPKDCRKIPFYKCSCFLWSDRYISVGQPEKQHTQMTTNRSNVGSSGIYIYICVCVCRSSLNPWFSIARSFFARTSLRFAQTVPMFIQGCQCELVLGSCYYCQVCKSKYRTNDWPLPWTVGP